MLRLSSNFDTLLNPDTTVVTGSVGDDSQGGGVWDAGMLISVRHCDTGALAGVADKVFSAYTGSIFNAAPTKSTETTDTIGCIHTIACTHTSFCPRPTPRHNPGYQRSTSSSSSCSTPLPPGDPGYQLHAAAPMSGSTLQPLLHASACTSKRIQQLHCMQQPTAPYMTAPLE
jgi:hypothetical protein